MVLGCFGFDIVFWGSKKSVFFRWYRSDSVGLRWSRGRGLVVLKERFSCRFRVGVMVNFVC